MNILYVTTIGSTMSFFPEHFKMLLDEGHTIELACNINVSPLDDVVSKLGLKVHDVSFSRSPLSPDNINACSRLKEIVTEGKFDIVHCHTPNASVATRLACRKLRKKGLKVFYTCHGFHFYKGAPLKNWLLFYPVEWLCSYWTDKLITINTEDYAFAKKHMHSKEISYIPGVGVNLDRFTDTFNDNVTLRESLHIGCYDKVLLSIGELNENKNHGIVIKALAKINRSDIHYMIAGKGDGYSKLEELAKQLGVADKVHLLGFRKDIPALLSMSDIYVLPSIREGLNVSIMEAMASGKPCVVSKIRGNVDLIDNEGGRLFSPFDVDSLVSSMEELLDAKDSELLSMGHYNKEKVKNFSNAAVLNQLEELYNF